MKSYFRIKTITPEEIKDITNGELIKFSSKDIFIKSICTDSREVEAGSLFCAIKGEKTDGNKYISSAIKDGAVCILTETMPEGDIKNKCAFVVVKDLLKAIASLAKWYRTFSKARIVAVTGSVGKTTTKELISYVLSEKFKVKKSEGNHNNEIGMPLTVMDISPDDEIVVLEMGMSGIGEIHEMSLIAEPDAAVITNIGSSHIEILGSRENISRAKLEIIDGLKENGKLILNGDEPLLRREKIKRKDIDITYVGLDNPSSDIRIVNIRPNKDIGSMFDLISNNSNVFLDVLIPLLGERNAYDAGVAIEVGKYFKLSEKEIRLGLTKYERTGLRQKIYKNKDYTIIADCYNASPESVKESLDVLSIYARKNNGNVVALLGDMLELGDASIMYHEQVGEYAAYKDIKKLFCFGEKSKYIAEGAIKKGIKPASIFVVENKDDHLKMAEIINENISKDDVLLVKASRGMKLEKVIEELEK